MRLLRREQLPLRLWATLFLAAGLAVTAGILLAYAANGLRGQFMSYGTLRVRRS